MGELIPGPYGDGLDPDEYEAAIEDAIHFFGCTRETAEANLNGPAVFKAISIEQNVGRIVRIVLKGVRPQFKRIFPCPDLPG